MHVLQIGELRCQAIQRDHGPYLAERTQKAVCIVRFLWVNPNEVLDFENSPELIHYLQALYFIQ
jgi:hypothetical protein